MNSLNPKVEALHQAYCDSLGIELSLNLTFERWWFAALKMDLSPDDVKICVKERLRFNRKSPMKKGLELKHLIRDEDDVAVVLNEVAVVRALMRIKVVPADKASVLKATGRPVEEETKPRSISEVIEAMRKQAS